MPEYRRNHLPGGTYFFTVTMRQRQSGLLVSQIQLLRSAVKMTLQRMPFHIDAWVVLPDHIHCIWTLPPDDADYPSRWKSIKTRFSKGLPLTKDRSEAQNRKGERGVWQRRYWEHTIRDERDYSAHMDYICFNPVKHGLVENVKDWPYSSFHRDVQKGFYPEDWASDVLVLEAGESKE